MKIRSPVCLVHANIPAVLVEQVDAYYCMACKKWLEEPCSDPDCQFCKDRPELIFPNSTVLSTEQFV